MATFAIWKLGATPMPLSSRLPAPERQSLLKLADPPLVVGLDDADESWTCIAAGFQPENPGAARLPRIEATQPWKAIASGGSTGRPKLILAGRPTVVDPAAAQYGIVPGDVVLVPGPLYHQGPFIFSTGGLFAGDVVVVMTRFDAVETLALIGRHRITWTYLVPTMSQRIWRLDQPVRDSYDLSSLRAVMSTGAPWAPWLKDAWIQWLGPERIFEGYGGTEEHGGLIITGLEALEHPGSVGRANDDVRVLDENYSEVPRGAMGEIYFGRPPRQRATSAPSSTMSTVGGATATSVSSPRTAMSISPIGGPT